MLESTLDTHILAQCLEHPQQVSAFVRSYKTSILNQDFSLLLSSLSTHPIASLIASVAQNTSWCRPCEVALDCGVQGTSGLQTRLKELSCQTLEDYKCRCGSKRECTLPQTHLWTLSRKGGWRTVANSRLGTLWLDLFTVVYLYNLLQALLFLFRIQNLYHANALWVALYMNFERCLNLDLFVFSKWRHVEKFVASQNCRSCQFADKRGQGE